MSTIDGVKIIPLQRIPDERGAILHMLRRTDPHFIGFGEIYFATIFPGVVKAWHKHNLMTLNYACIARRLKLVIYDERDASPTRGQLMEIFLGTENYCLVQIPPNLWNGHKGIGTERAILANCATHPHDPAQSVRIDPFNNHIPYDWSLKHR